MDVFVQVLLILVLKYGIEKKENKFSLYMDMKNGSNVSLNLIMGLYYQALTIELLKFGNLKEVMILIIN